MNSSRNQDLFYRISLYGGGGSIILFPVSISLSQAALAIALIGWFGYALTQKYDIQSGSRLPFVSHPVLLFAFSIYCGEFLSLLVHALIDPKIGTIEAALRGEPKDVLLLSMAFWTLSVSSRTDGKEFLYRMVKISAAVLIGSGFLSLFTRFRLSRIPYHLMHGWEGSAQARLQHIAASFGNGSFSLYMPIGFMNTHLTYAALMSFFFPWLLFRWLDPIVKDPALLKQQKSWRRFALVALTGIILVLNNGRSAIFGLVIALLFGFYYFIRVYWKGALRRLLPLLGGVALVTLVALVFAVRQGGRLKESVEALSGQKKHTDYQRIFLWQMVTQIIREKPVFGVGPGQFPGAVRKRVIEQSLLHPLSWPDYEFVQRGHAHNDLLHLQAIAGPLAPLFYLLFFFSLLSILLERSASIEEEYWKWGPVSLLFSGLLQCYFQDDEVLLPFWLFTALALRGVIDRKRQEERGGLVDG